MKYTPTQRYARQKEQFASYVFKPGSYLSHCPDCRYRNSDNCERCGGLGTVPVVTVPANRRFL